MYVPYSPVPPPKRYLFAVASPDEKQQRAARQRRLVEQLAATDRAQQQLAQQLADIRRQLAAHRVLAFPTLDKDLVRGFRHTFPNGPEPIPPPPRNAISLRGPRLRHAVISILLRAATPLPLPEIHRRLHLEGFRIEHRYPVKYLADALAHEHERGRAVRVRRGCYRIGTLDARSRRMTDDDGDA